MVTDAVGVAGNALTVIVPVAFTLVQAAPVTGIVYVNVPEVVGVPLIVMVPAPGVAVAAQEAFIPGGKLLGVPIPVAPVVVCVIDVVNAVLIHKLGVEEAGPTSQQFVGPVMLTVADAAEIQPPEFVTVNV
jgi:hypothetical protein